MRGFIPRFFLLYSEPSGLEANLPHPVGEKRASGERSLESEALQ